MRILKIYNLKGENPVIAFGRTLLRPASTESESIQSHVPEHDDELVTAFRRSVLVIRGSSVVFKRPSQPIAPTESRLAFLQHSHRRLIVATLVIGQLAAYVIEHYAGVIVELVRHVATALCNDG